MLLLLAMWLSNCQQMDDNGSSVATPEALTEAVAAAGPGDVITLANGTWKDAELVFTGQGTAEAPITLRAETKGEVLLTGQSSLGISGEHLVVEGLVFKEGYTPTGEVIAFRTSSDELCNHCRVTECVIDHYTNPERFESDYWVGVYGKNNRLDHNYLVGKGNQGVTVAVRLNTEASRENRHRIDHNYFGYNPILGSNGGETLRIGTSHYADKNSNTLVENNYFDRCNGEHEIISNKSGQNTFRGNTFYECQGTLTMRHGNETLVENNYFFGNGRPNTGGIRIINEKQTVRGNYGEGLTGHRFRGALVIMNGVPNSPPNRYMPVVGSTAENNVFVNCDHVQFGAGADEERSQPPTSTTVSGNVFYHESKADIFTVYDDMSGITFTDNLLGEGMEGLTEAGFTSRELEWEDADGVMIPVGTKAGELLRAGLDDRATAENTGVDWYPKVNGEIRFNTGRRISVAAGTNTLFEAVREAEAGDVLVLSEAGDYLTTKGIEITVPLTITADKGLPAKPTLTFQPTSLFNIENGGALTLWGVRVNGKECRDRPRNAVIRTSRYSMNENYKLFIEDCDFEDLDVNHSFDVVRVYKNTFADSVVLRNSTFRNISGSVLPYNQENNDIGIYNVETVVVENCLFDGIGQAALHLHRGGRDESTFGPMVTIDRCTFDEVGTDGKWNKSNSSIRLHGTQFVRVTNCVFDDSAPVRLHLVVGEPIVAIKNSLFAGGTELLDNGEPYVTTNLRYATEPAAELPDGTPVGTKISE